DHSALVLAVVDVEAAGDVALADLAAELAERPHAAAVLEVPAQAVRRRPRKWHRNDRIELRKVASLQRKHAIDVVDARRNDRAVELGAGRARLRLHFESIRPIGV